MSGENVSPLGKKEQKKSQVAEGGSYARMKLFSQKGGANGCGFIFSYGEEGVKYIT